MKKLLTTAALAALFSGQAFAQATTTTIEANLDVEPICDVDPDGNDAEFDENGLASVDVFVQCNTRNDVQVLINTNSDRLASDDDAGPDYRLRWNDLTSLNFSNNIDFNPTGDINDTRQSLAGGNTALALGGDTTVELEIIGDVPVFEGNYDTVVTLSIGVF